MELLIPSLPRFGTVAMFVEPAFQSEPNPRAPGALGPGTASTGPHINTAPETDRIPQQSACAMIDMGLGSGDRTVSEP